MLDTEHAIVQTASGVILPPPPAIPFDFHRLVEQELAKESHATNGVVLDITLQSGINFVLAHRTQKGWELDFYAGSKWDWDPTVGARVAKRW